MARKDKKKDPAKESIFEEEKQNKKTAGKVLELAKRQEKEKLKSGFKYEVSADGKTRTLKKAQ